MESKMDNEEIEVIQAADSPIAQPEQPESNQEQHEDRGDEIKDCDLTFLRTVWAIPDISSGFY